MSVANPLIYILSQFAFECAYKYVRNVRNLQVVVVEYFESKSMFYVCTFFSGIFFSLALLFTLSTQKLLLHGETGLYRDDFKFCDTQQAIAIAMQPATKPIAGEIKKVEFKN